MALSRTSPLTTAAIRVAAAGLGSAVAGPLGGALGAVIGNALGPSAAELVETFTEKFGEEAGKKFLDTDADSLVERFKQFAPDLESVYRQALRLSLSQVRSPISATREPEFDSWFTNWDVCLNATVALSLEQIQPIHLAAEGRDAPFRRTMERLDAQGEAIQRHDPSLNLQTRILPDPLLAQLTTYIPDHFEENFRALIVQTKYEQAWRQAEFIFRDSVRVVFSNIERQTRLLPQIAKDTAVIRQQFTSREAFDQRFFERYEDAVRRGLIADLKLQELEAERERQAKELRNLQEQLAVRSSEPVEAQLFKLLEAGDLDAALRLKSQQVQTRREESDRLPRDLFELGTIYELRFEWPQALAAYREAWELRKDPDHGLKYARFAQKLKSFGHATAAYEALLLI